MNIAMTPTMKAIRFPTYGGPEVLQYEDVPRPIAGPGEVLVRIHAAGINPGDKNIRAGIANKQFGLTIPFPFIPGNDLSGEIAAVGPEVTAFQVGDLVYGLTMNGATYAEYATAQASQLAHKPPFMDHIQAAGVPLAALTAWQALFDHGHLEARQVVLINGASGGVGHFAVQFAKRKGARVIGVASGRNEAFLRELGVDQFIDYTATPVEKAAQNVDLVFDAVGGKHGNRLLQVLKRGGALVPIFWGEYSVEQAAAASVTIQDIAWVQPNAAQLDEIGRLIGLEHVHIHIETVLPLAEARKAHELIEGGQIRGKVVLRVAE
ncbi:NADP-dependent oxidoreductase [Ktedonospora formicarum]|uniref:NADPH:quinone reductase n=1 Tax=Ktedonospora formicarum TaxID=2778364 RepID=A0A8J3IAC3_9CHLR|nr:NADP-dependent oxidoreductase [Ktedonospora formicarum]GHO50341.1 NADPH:quinone reductase [Ktedonospora formicarum]